MCLLYPWQRVFNILIYRIVCDIITSLLQCKGGAERKTKVKYAVPVANKVLGKEVKQLTVSMDFDLLLSDMAFYALPFA